MISSRGGGGGGGHSEIFHIRRLGGLFVDKNFEFPQFWGFSENVNIFGYGHLFRYLLGIPSKFDYFMGLCFTNVWFL